MFFNWNATLTFMVDILVRITTRHKKENAPNRQLFMPTSPTIRDEFENSSYGNRLKQKLFFYNTLSSNLNCKSALSTLNTVLFVFGVPHLLCMKSTLRCCTKINLLSSQLLACLMSEEINEHVNNSDLCYQKVRLLT